MHCMEPLSYPCKVYRTFHLFSFHSFTCVMLHMPDCKTCSRTVRSGYDTNIRSVEFVGLYFYRTVSVLSECLLLVNKVLDIIAPIIATLVIYTNSHSIFHCMEPYFTLGNVTVLSESTFLGNLLMHYLDLIVKML